jgi:integrase/recombinase XerD
MPDTWHSKLYDNRLDVVNDFLSKKKSLGRSERTLNEYSRLLKRFFHDVFPEQSAGEIQVGHIEEYVTVLDGRECGQNTKRRYLETLSSFYTWTMKRPRLEEITGNPAAVVLEEIPKKVQPRPDCATWSKGKEIVHRVANPRDKTIVALLAKTGCRMTEALSIQMDDAMLEEGFYPTTCAEGREADGGPD